MDLGAAFTASLGGAAFGVLAATLAFTGAVTLGAGALFALLLSLTWATLALTTGFLGAGLATGLATDFEGALAPVLGDALAFAADFFTQSLLEGQQPNNAMTP